VHRLRPIGNHSYHANDVRQHLWNRRLYDQMGGLTKRAIGGIRLPIQVRVRYLHNACQRDERATENA
jgi:hypothetical protein